MSLEIISLTLGPAVTNAYLIADDSSGEAAVIDPAWDGHLILEATQKRGWRIANIWRTHAHFDHLGGAPRVRGGSTPPPACSGFRPRHRRIERHPEPKGSAARHGPVLAPRCPWLPMGNNAAQKRRPPGMGGLDMGLLKIRYVVKSATPTVAVGRSYVRRPRAAAAHPEAQAPRPAGPVKPPPGPWVRSSPVCSPDRRPNRARPAGGDQAQPKG